MGLNKGLVLGVLSTLTFAACSPNKAADTNAQVDASSTQDSAIINGKLVTADDQISKNIVGIISANKDEEGEAICTGSLLPGNLVLTAAHCLGDYMMIVFAPDMDTATEGQMLPVDKAAASPYWESRKNQDKDTGDVALLHYKGTTPKGFIPATMLTDMSVLQKGAKVTLAGYGANKVTLTPIDSKTYPDIINAIQTGKVICDDNMKLTNCVENNMFGAGQLRKTDNVKIEDPKFSLTEVLLNQKQGEGACHGDSGGPAYITVKGKIYLWGITNRGERDPKNDCSQYSVYTKAYSYKTWLNGVAKQFTAPSITDPNRLGSSQTAN
ncbi:trypsin-like serine protease [Bdellovibrio sp. NC01]|uniref:S1 family peptidase n=1 Tax=Bdellovibrio sp. NC01 TaxID=2220073 RepID=UPI00143D0DB3|nr:trypsin-like serine protease [Bdellovibrio sp. NC01]